MLYDLSGLTDAEQSIMETFSVFPYIPLSAETCNEWLLADAGVDADADIFIGLYEKGWLQFDIERESYALHPVFAQFIYGKCKPEQKKHQGLIKACQKTLEIPENGYALECQKYIPFAEGIIVKLNMRKMKRADFIFSLAYLFQYIGNYKQADQYYKEILKIHEDEYMFPYVEKYSWEERWRKGFSGDMWDEKHLKLAAVYNNLGGIYVKQRNYKEAEKVLEKGLIIRESILGENHSETASSYNVLGGLYMAQGEYKKAEKFFEKGLMVRKNILKENHPDIANSYNNLGAIYERQKQYEKAEEFYKKGLAIRKYILKENHPDIANSYNNLGGLFRKQGKLEKAEKFLGISLEIERSMLGERHINTINSQSNLLDVYVEQGRYEEAERLYKENIEFYKGVLGENHPDIATDYNNLAYTYEKQGNHKEALNYFLKAYKIYIAQLGANHNYTKTTYNNIKTIYIKLRKKIRFEIWLKEKMKESD